VRRWVLACLVGLAAAGAVAGFAGVEGPSLVPVAAPAPPVRLPESLQALETGWPGPGAASTSAVAAVREQGGCRAGLHLDPGDGVRGWHWHVIGRAVCDGVG
jgi:hypothetical protein